MASHLKHIIFMLKYGFGFPNNVLFSPGLLLVLPFLWEIFYGMYDVYNRWYFNKLGVPFVWHRVYGKPHSLLGGFNWLFDDFDMASSYSCGLTCGHDVLSQNINEKWIVPVICVGFEISFCVYVGDFVKVLDDLDCAAWTEILLLWGRWSWIIFLWRNGIP